MPQKRSSKSRCPTRQVIFRWAVKWSSGPDNIDRKLNEHFCFNQPEDMRYEYRTVPAFFRTRNAARDWRDRHFGYLRDRSDLKKYPHNWRLPRVVRVDITVTEVPCLKKRKLLRR
jgi:hypothetical protein